MMPEEFQVVNSTVKRCKVESLRTSIVDDNEDTFTLESCYDVSDTHPQHDTLNQLKGSEMINVPVDLEAAC